MLLSPGPGAWLRWTPQLQEMLPSPEQSRMSTTRVAVPLDRERGRGEGQDSAPRRASPGARTPCLYSMHDFPSLARFHHPGLRVVGGGDQDQRRQVSELGEGEPEARGQQRAQPRPLQLCTHSPGLGDPQPRGWGRRACPDRARPARTRDADFKGRQAGARRPRFFAGVCLLPGKEPSPKEEGVPAPGTSPPKHHSLMKAYVGPEEGCRPSPGRGVTQGLCGCLGVCQLACGCTSGGDARVPQVHI